jgi:outer membrane protein assembly factor BamB
MATGNIENVFSVVPDGCLGGSIWGSPSIDAKTGELYIATGNPDTCSTTEPNATSLLKLHASDLSLVDSWQVPEDQRVIDSDFGSAPTLFTATIDGVSQNLVGVAHKNGIFYAFERDAIGNGPIWEAQIASGGSCPECGQGSISPAAWDGSMLYVAGGNTTIGGAGCAGSVRALDPATGNFLWEACIGDGPVLAPVTVVSGVVVVTAGPSIIVIDAKSGKTLFTFTDAHPDSTFYGPGTIAEGVLYAGNVDGNLYAFGLYLRTPNPRMR